MAESGDTETAEGAADVPVENAAQDGPEFQAPDFEQVTDGVPAATSAEPDIDVILDVPVTLSLEVGRAEMSVGDLLRLNHGAVVELDRKAGEPLDVLVNGALVARGEIVVVNDKFGIRLTEVVSHKKIPKG